MGMGVGAGVGDSTIDNRYPCTRQSIAVLLGDGRYSVVHKRYLVPYSTIEPSIIGTLVLDNRQQFY